MFSSHFSHFFCDRSVNLSYRGSPDSLFEELADILDCISTFSDPLIVAGDFNIHVERKNDSAANKLINLMSAYGICLAK